MAIISDEQYKLDIHNTRLNNLRFKCREDENSCRLLTKKLVFYRRDDVLDMHSNNLYYEQPYDIELLEKIEFLDKMETIDRIVPLDRRWLGVLIKNKKTNEPNLNKVMYISPEGDGYLCDEIEPALNGYVPESVYLKNAREIPGGFAWLDEKYQDGTHNEFMKKYVQASRDFIELWANGLIRSIKDKLLNKEFANKERITLEEFIEAIEIEFRKKVRGEDFYIYESLDFMLTHFGADRVMKLSEKYCGNPNEEKTQNIENNNEK